MLAFLSSHYVPGFPWLLGLYSTFQHVQDLGKVSRVEANLCFTDEESEVQGVWPDVPKN